MAQNFRRLMLTGVGTAVADVPDGADFTHYNTIVGINLANTTDNMILADAYVTDSTPNPDTNHYIVKNAAIPAGSSIHIGGKFVVQSGDRLYFKSDTASSLDVIVSYVQEIST